MIDQDIKFIYRLIKSAKVEIVPTGKRVLWRVDCRDGLQNSSEYYVNFTIYGQITA